MWDSVTATTSVSAQQLPAFRRGGSVVAEVDVRGQRGAYLVHDRISLAPGEQRTWRVVGDVDQDAAKVVELRDLLTKTGGAGFAA